MGRHGVIELPAITPRARLRVDAFAPRRASIRLTYNGRVLDRINVEGQFAREYEVASRPDSPNQLQIETDNVVRVSTDTRDLGVRIDRIDWVLLDAP
jgi:hypothetical protein